MNMITTDALSIEHSNSPNNNPDKPPGFLLALSPDYISEVDLSNQRTTNFGSSLYSLVAGLSSVNMGKMPPRKILFTILNNFRLLAIQTHLGPEHNRTSSFPVIHSSPSTFVLQNGTSFPYNKNYPPISCFDVPKTTGIYICLNNPSCYLGKFLISSSTSSVNEELPKRFSPQNFITWHNLYGQTIAYKELLSFLWYLNICLRLEDNYSSESAITNNCLYFIFEPAQPSPNVAAKDCEYHCYMRFAKHVTATSINELTNALRTEVKTFFNIPCGSWSYCPGNFTDPSLGAENITTSSWSPATESAHRTLVLKNKDESLVIVSANNGNIWKGTRFEVLQSLQMVGKSEREKEQEVFSSEIEELLSLNNNKKEIGDNGQS